MLRATSPSNPTGPSHGLPREGGLRRWIAVLLGLAGLAFSDAAGAPTTEEFVKSGYVVLFAENVRWPGLEDTGEESDEPFVIAILGEDSLGPDLERVARDRRVAGRRIEVRRVASSSEARNAHVIYIGRAEERRAQVWLGELESCSALIVTEIGSTLETGAGVVIDLVPAGQGGRRVRFDVNLAAVQERGLQVAAPMLQAARTIIGGPQRVE